MPLPAPRSQNNSPDRVVAAALIGIGAVIAAGTLFPSVGPYVVLAIGAVCLGAFVLTREYGFAIPAGLMTGFGTGIALATNTVNPAAAGGGFMLSIATGFLVIWLLGLAARPVERHPWPLVPGAIMGTIGISAVLGRPEIVTMGAGLAATALVGAGLLLMFRRGVPSQS